MRDDVQVDETHERNIPPRNLKGSKQHANKEDCGDCTGGDCAGGGISNQRAHRQPIGQSHLPAFLTSYSECLRQ